METDIHPKLIELFRTIFLELSSAEVGQIEKARREALESWDSANQLLLITMLEDEYKIQIPDDELAEMDSFASVSVIVSHLIQ